MAWLIEKIDPRPSKKEPGSICYHIQFRNVKTHSSAKTYVESTFRNYQNWREVVENSQRSFIVSNIQPEQGIVNADSYPVVEISTDPETMNQQLQQHWLGPKNSYGDLFE